MQDRKNYFDMVKEARLPKDNILSQRVVRSDADEEGEWITVKGAHVHLNEEGVPDKGPNKIVSGMKGSSNLKSEEKSSREQERENTRKQLEAERKKALENQVVENKDRYKSEECKLATCEHTRYSDMLTDAFDTGDRDQFTAVAEGCERGNVIDGDYMWAECTGGKKFDIYVAGVKHGSVSASKLYSEFKKRKENCREGITLYYPHTWIE